MLSKFLKLEELEKWLGDSETRQRIHGGGESQNAGW